MRISVVVSILLFVISGPIQAGAPADEFVQRDYMTTKVVKDKFTYIRDAIKMAIGDRGIKINNISHIGNMLERTKEAVGATKTVYLHAEAIEFCSSTVSRETMEADPHNITFCPYIIAVYELPEQPGTIYVSYRKPLLVGDERSRNALKAVGDLLDGIVQDAIQ